MDEGTSLARYRQTGDMELLGALYAPYIPLLYGVCFKYLQDQDKSQDAVMQIFEELITKLKTNEVQNFKSWLYVYAKNYCLMQMRRERKNQHVDIDENAYEAESVLHVSGGTEDDWTESDFERLERCIDTLNAPQERCIRLFFIEQKCYKEIVELTGYDLNQVKSYLQNGRRNLKICMEKNHG